MLISEMELSQDCGYSAVLWWRRFLIFENICTPFCSLVHQVSAMSGLIRMYLWMADKKQDKCPSPGAPRVQSPEAWHSPEAEPSAVPVFYDNYDYKSPPLQGNYFCEEIKCSIQL